MAGGIDPDSIMIAFNALSTRANTKRDWSRSWRRSSKAFILKSNSLFYFCTSLIFNLY